MGEPFTVSLSLTIRPCIEEDVPALEWFGMFTPHRELLAQAWARCRTGDNPMLVADLDGFPVGQVWIDLARRVPEPVGMIWALRVLPCLQRLGIGARLLAAAEAEIRRRGRQIAEIGVEKENPDARRLYERLGYRAAGEELEDFKYTTPWGEERREVVDQWILRKHLGL